MRHGSAHLIVAVLVLATALTSAARHRKPAARMLPPGPFVTTPAPTTLNHNTTTANVTTTPTPHNTTTTNITTTVPTPQNTTTANITTTVAPHNTTTTNMTTTTVAPHNTTTTNMTTTTVAPHNTTTTNMTTTTVAPHNTTTANQTTPNTTTPPSPQPRPTPTTNITVGNYSVKIGNKLCIMVQAAIQVHVNNSKEHIVGTYIVPGNATSDGNCQLNKSSLKIILNEGYISMDFIKNDTTNVVFVSAVAVNLSYAFKSGELSRLNRKSDGLQLFTMKTSHSYSCKSESVSLGDDTYLEFSQERIQAFNFTNNQFGPIDLCKADQPDYRVAIGVGVALLILIIIVVLAYLLSRKKRTAGYQTL